MTLSRRTRNAGFTLVEIMIVVAIIGLLAAIAIPNLKRSREAAARTACHANLKTIDGVKQNWALDFKKANTDVPGDGDLFGEGKYIAEKPQCPGGGTYTIGAVSEKATCSNSDHNY